MKIVVAADHGGFELKVKLKQYLSEQGHEVVDVGALEYLGLDGFTDYSKQAIERIREAQGTFGVFVCGTGTLAAMSANRFKGIRAAMCHVPEYAIQAREHNDANVLCLGGRYLDFEDAKRIVKAFLNTKFLGGKYKARIDMLDE